MLFGGEGYHEYCEICCELESQINKLNQDKARLIEALKFTTELHCLTCADIDVYEKPLVQKCCNQCNVRTYYKAIQEVLNDNT